MEISFDVIYFFYSNVLQVFHSKYIHVKTRILYKEQRKIINNLHCTIYIDLRRFIYICPIRRIKNCICLIIYKTKKKLLMRNNITCVFVCLRRMNSIHNICIYNVCMADECTHNTYMWCVHICIYIYIHISTSRRVIHVCIYMYVYVPICVHILYDIYIHENQI